VSISPASPPTLPSAKASSEPEGVWIKAGIRIFGYASIPRSKTTASMSWPKVCEGKADVISKIERNENKRIARYLLLEVEIVYED
jgi:hypothetical protein